MGQEQSSNPNNSKDLLISLGVRAEDVLGEADYKTYVHSAGRLPLDNFVDPASVLGEGSYKTYLYEKNKIVPGNSGEDND